MFNGQPGRRNARGFTFVELVLVLFIILLLSAMAVPMFSGLLKNSRVKQAANAAFTAVWRARAEAQRNRCTVAVYYGEDPDITGTNGADGKIPTRPNILPKYGQIETWKVGCDLGDYVGEAGGPTCSLYGWCPGGWCGFTDKDRILSSPLSFPEGARILAGYYSHPAGTINQWDFYEYQKADPMKVGEVKRHHNAFSESGRTIGYGTGNNWQYFIAFDSQTGEHQICITGLWTSNSRPLFLDQKLTQVGGNVLNRDSDILKYIDSYPDN